MKRKTASTIVVTAALFNVRGGETFDYFSARRPYTGRKIKRRTACTIVVTAALFNVRGGENFDYFLVFIALNLQNKSHMHFYRKLKVCIGFCGETSADLLIARSAVRQHRCTCGRGPATVH